MAERIAALKRKARAARVPVVYVNDNFGRWQSDLNNQVRHCLDDGVRGKPIVEMLQPEPDDYFVLKPKHSGFESTSLDILLSHLRVGRLILSGVAGDFCVLFTAHDAYMRGYELLVPGDCTASDTAEDNRAALRHMAKVCKADIRPSSGISFEDAAKGQGQISLSRRASR
jgi:nicotinamidase-related amidase